MTTEELTPEVKKQLDELKAEIHKSVMILYHAAADGAILAYSDMISCLETLSRRYEDEYIALTDDFVHCDSNEAHDAIDDIKGVKERRSPLQEHCKDFLKFLPIIDKVMNSWVNEDGKICDEYGRPLSNDLEHRVFEVIKGAKFNKD